MAKRKVDTENRTFKTRWESEYMFTEVAGKPVCLLCGESVAVMKEFNLRRHHETKHVDKDKDMDMEQRLQKVEELKRGLKSWQALFRKAKSQSEAAVKARFILAEEIAKSARPFTEGDFIKNRMLKVCDEVCPDKRQLFSNVSLSRNTIAERVDELSINLKEQLVKKGKEFIAYSLAVDESTDISDIAQFVLAADIRRRFADFEAQKSRFELLSNTFAVDVGSSPPNLQMELIELQCSDALKAKNVAVGAAEFARFLPETVPQLHIQAMFGSTYLCEQLFSLMKLNKTSHRSRLTAEHLHSILRISSAQSLAPNIDELVQKMRHHQVSATASKK
uniref:SPIN-DOC-like zinc-finger domain-containing protein n=1 Tax=Denticeps clupeoides TaxID=299321 RepID=A0AAY4BEV8_9TELE